MCVCLSLCSEMCVGGYVFTCLSLLAHNLAGSLVRQFHMYSIFNLYVALNRDTCLLMRRKASQSFVVGTGFTVSHCGRILLYEALKAQQDKL